MLIATGSGVHLILAARRELARRGVGARVVSLPSWEVWEEQGPEYRQEVLPPGTPRLAVEAGVSRGWKDVVGAAAEVIGVDRFGASGSGEAVYEELGFTVDNVVETALGLVTDQSVEEV